MLLQLAVVIVLLSLQAGNAQRCAIVAVDRDRLREEFRQQVSTVLEQTTTNVSRLHQLQCGIEGASLRDQISKQTTTTLEVIEGTVKEMKGRIKSLDVGLREFVNDTVHTIVTEAVDKAVNTAVETRLITVVEKAVENSTKSVEQLLQSLLNEVALQKLPGTASNNPANSCKGIKTASPASPSGYYWLTAGNGSSIRVYCDMTRTCGGITGGWMQVANIDMSDSSHTCPQGLRTITTPIRMCSRSTTSPGCNFAIFNTYGIQYSRVCGTVIGYQDQTPDAFNSYNGNSALTIDDNYIDGVSITHGNSPRKHIWSFAAANSEQQGPFPTSNCPCTTQKTTAIPPWVANDYFCDTAAERPQHKFFPDDPLWDGEGCGPTSTCCSFNNPPWFSTQLPSPTTDDIEMRLCIDESIDNEDITVEKVNLYVQ